MVSLRRRDLPIPEADARRLLGLFNGYDEDDVRRAFVAAVTAAHPDAGGQGGDLDMLSQARDTLLLLYGVNIACPQCLGRGSIRGRFGNVPCGRCEGAGNVA